MAIERTLADKLLEIALKQLQESINFKKERMERLRDYDFLYHGKLRQKLRQGNDVILPVFSGLVNTLESDFDDPIKLEFEEQDPKDYAAYKKVNAAWDTEYSRPEKKFEQKNRWEKHLAIISGRGIKMFYAESDPSYSSHIDILPIQRFYFEPKGGGYLEKHLFCGHGGIHKSKSALEKGVENEIYDAANVKKLTDITAESEYKADDDTRTLFANFEAMGLDPEKNNYVGEVTYNMVQWCMTYQGTRYFLLFDPWTKTWIRAELLKDVFASNLYPYVSWATHEDPTNFLSKSYADDFYPVAMGIIGLVIQEITNREKRNLGSKAFDVEMFRDVAKLDAAQYRPDGLVPVRVPPGKTIQDGIFMFTTPELQGTISLVNFLEGALSRETGVDDMNQPGAKGKNASVVFARLQQAQKRIGHKAKAYTEAWAEIGIRYVWGLYEHLGEPMMIKMLGKDGWGWDELKRSDLQFRRGFSVKVISTVEQDRDNVLGKDQKLKAVDLIINNKFLMSENNPKVLSEILWRDMAGMDDDFISRVMDTDNYGDKDVMAAADLCIQKLAKGKMPEIVYDANLSFIRKIYAFEKRHQGSLKPEAQKMFYDFLEQHVKIVAENMADLARQTKLAQSMAAASDPERAAKGGGAPQQQPQPQPQPATARMGLPGVVRQSQNEVAPQQ